MADTSEELTKIRALMENALAHIYSIEIRIGALESFIIRSGKPEGFTDEQAFTAYHDHMDNLKARFSEWTDLLDKDRGTEGSGLDPHGE